MGRAPVNPSGCLTRSLTLEIIPLRFEPGLDRRPAIAFGEGGIVEARFADPQVAIAPTNIVGNTERGQILQDASALAALYLGERIVGAGRATHCDGRGPCAVVQRRVRERPDAPDDRGNGPDDRESPAAHADVPLVPRQLPHECDLL